MTALGIDYGAVRIGVARQIAGTNIATALATVSPDLFDDKLNDWISQYDITEVFVGLPKSLSGDDGPAARQVRTWVSAQQIKFPLLSWHLVDERLTSVSASKSLAEQGLSAKAQRGQIDEVAAVMILQQALASNLGIADKND